MNDLLDDPTSLLEDGGYQCHAFFEKNQQAKLRRELFETLKTDANASASYASQYGCDNFTTMFHAIEVHLSTDEAQRLGGTPPPGSFDDPRRI